jgi:AcrR family transcriptional regulator
MLRCRHYDDSRSSQLIEKTAERPPGDLYAVRARARAGLDEIGLRERHKMDKLDRISDAAHKLFARDGYEGTSLREIAKEAGVALGTLSLYACDKRDLVLLIFNKVIPPLLEQAVRGSRGRGKLATNVTAFYEPFYRAYARNVTLYRIVLGQIYSGPGSVHANENNMIRLGMIDSLSDIISRAIASGECASHIDTKFQARSFYYLYFAAVRAWLSQPEPRPEQGMTELRALFEQHVRGLLPNR